MGIGGFSLIVSACSGFLADSDDSEVKLWIDRRSGPEVPRAGLWFFKAVLAAALLSHDRSGIGVPAFLIGRLAGSAARRVLLSLTRIAVT